MAWRRLPPRSPRPTVIDQRRFVPREPGSPGAFVSGDEEVRIPGQVPNDGDSPGLPSGIGLDPSLPGSSGVTNASLNLDTGGQIRIIVGKTPVVTTVAVPDVLGALPELVVPLEVIAWELISLTCIYNSPVNGIDIPQLSFDDGPFSASRAGNVYFISEPAANALGAGMVNLPIGWAQGGSRGTVQTASHPVLGNLPPNNRILSGHHIRFRLNDVSVAPVNGWSLSGFVACVREWRAPR